VVFPWEIKETVRKIVKRCRERGKSLEEETEKLVKAGIAGELLERLLNEVFEEENC
jgi:hypothetical protein